MTKVLKKKITIGFLDSGSGGLSILKEVQKKIPKANYKYLFDNLFFPYGELDSSKLSKRVLTLSEKFCLTQNLDLLVIACNTASTLVLEELRKKISIPIVGVVPAIKTASELSKTGTIGIIATKITTESPYLEKLVRDFAPSLCVLKKASPKLVELSEQKRNGKKTNLALIKSEINDFLSHKTLDTIVLGCTHYSELLPEFKSLDNKNISWVDSREAIARRVVFLLKIKKENPSTKPIPLEVFYTEAYSFSKKNWINCLPGSKFKHFPC